MISALLSSTMPAFAQSLRDPLAQSLKAEGDAAMSASRFAEALDDYERAAAIESSPVFDYNRGRALQALGRNAEALGQLERFEGRAPPDLKARVPQLEGLLAEVRAHVGTVEIRCDVAGARVRIGSHVLVTTPLSKPIYVDSGPYELVVEARGYAKDKRPIDVPAGGSLELDLALVKLETSATLRVTSAATGARLSLDGEPAGQIPIEVALEPGVHRLRLELTGYDPHESRVVLAARERRELRIDLRTTPPIYVKWWFWTGIGVVAAASAVTLIAVKTERGADKGDIAPGSLAAPLFRF
jgi:tetratricopeptide (TPR) repeat protein